MIFFNNEPHPEVTGRLPIRKQSCGSAVQLLHTSADQHLWFRYSHGAISLLPKFEISSLL